MEMKPISNSEKEAFVTVTLDNPNAYDAKSKRRNNSSSVIFNQCFRQVKHASCYNTRNKVFLVAVLWIIVNTLMYQFRVHHTKKLAKGAQVSMDYSDVKSVDDLKAIRNNLDYICFPGMEKSCKCPDPMVGLDRQGRRHWLKTSNENKDKALSVKDDVDVVFYGDSITEGWMGTSFGFPNGRKEHNEQVFNSLFTLENGGKYKGIALGISGDLTTSLLWRLENGELPQTLQPKVFWVLIGTNDLGNKWCSPDATVLGILRVVEAIRHYRPGAIIVINSIFPRSWRRNGSVLKGKGLGKGRVLPELWTSISDINAHLKVYSENHENVEYFDANDAFFLQGENEKKKDVKIDKNLMYDYLHPSHVGYRLWGNQIVRKLDVLIG